MKITVRESKVKPEFRAGDYFISYDGAYLRKIELLEDGRYAIVDPITGDKSATTTSSPQEIAEIYVETNGPIEKLKVVEIVVEKTGEILEVE